MTTTTSPEHAEFPVYLIARNSFTFEFVDDQGAPADLAGQFTDIRAILLQPFDRKTELAEIDITIDAGQISAEFTPEQTEEFFTDGQRCIEFRFFSGSGYRVRLVAWPILSDAFITRTATPTPPIVI